MRFINNLKFWELIDRLVAESKIVIDRPKGSRHPKFYETVYPVDYGYLEGTSSMDKEGIDIFCGTSKDKKVDAVAVTVDIFKRDSEIIILFGCTNEEKEKIREYLNKYNLMKGIIIEKN